MAQTLKLTEPGEQLQISDVQYANDPVPDVAPYIAAESRSFFDKETYITDQYKENSIRLQPFSAGLPYRCTLDAVYESKFWQEGLNASTELLQLLTQDHSTLENVRSEITEIGSLAQWALKPGYEHGFVKATSYMYPFADEERTKLLAASMVMLFLFDDRAEDAADGSVRCLAKTFHIIVATFNDFEQIQAFRDDFADRVDNHASREFSATEVQRYTDRVMQGFRDADSTAGNAGMEILSILRDFFQRIHPERTFENLQQYLDFRRPNIGGKFVLTAIKFSLCSSVDITNPRMARYLELVQNHLGINNDLVSFDKEYRAYQNGSSPDLINIVEVIRKLFSLPDVASAKNFAYTYQLQTEQWMVEELVRLKEEGGLDTADWQYLEATFVCTAGSTFYGMTSSRYGRSAIETSLDEVVQAQD